jgi:hypothetical protein
MRRRFEALRPRHELMRGQADGHQLIWTLWSTPAAISAPAMARLIGFMSPCDRRFMI